MNNNWDEHKELQVLKDRLSERYSDPVFIGSKGYGKVFKIWDNKNKRNCTLKVLSLDNINKLEPEENKEIHERFIADAKCYSRCNHPNIVKIYEVGEDDTLPYLVMEYIEGINLEGFLKEKVKMDFQEVLKLSDAILPALGYMHENGLVHRYLKPVNIMVDGDDSKKRYVLIGFGIIKESFSSSMTTSSMKIGVPYYIAPEQWQSASNVIPETDIYSFGVTLFKMVTGDVPFSGSLSDIMQGHLSKSVPKVKNKNHAVPKGIQEIIEKAMAKDPKNRYRSTIELLKALKRLASAVT